nr:MAG: DNA pilot protein [Microvirus sp.]
MGLFGDAIGKVFGFIDSNLENNRIKDANTTQYDIAKEFAQSGIQWRVADAKAAGISPLAALGVPLASGPTMAIGGSGGSSPFSDMGQSLGRAIDAVSTSKERSVRASLDGLALERASLENELLRSQITSVNRANNPPLPSMVSSPASPATGAPTGTRTVPVEVSSAAGAKASGIHPDLTYVRTSAGGLAIVPSKDAKQLIEDQMVPEAMWTLRNHIGTFVKAPPYPSEATPPKGAKGWKWMPMLQEWRPDYGKSSSLLDDAKRYWRKYVNERR